MKTLQTLRKLIWSFLLPSGLLLVASLALYGLMTWLFYLVNEVNYITNILVAIDGTKISFVFLATALGFACAWVLALVCAMRCSKVLKKAEEAKREGGAEA